MDKEVQDSGTAKYQKMVQDGRKHFDKFVNLVRYGKGYDIMLGISLKEDSKNIKGSLCNLSPEDADELADGLRAIATEAREIRDGS